MIALSWNEKDLKNGRLKISFGDSVDKNKVCKVWFKNNWTGFRAYNSRCRAARVKRQSSADSSYNFH